MLLVLLTHDPERVSLGVAEEIAFILPQFVAEALTLQEADGQLSPEDIEVRVQSKGPYDIDHYDLSVIIFANDYPSRRAKLDEARTNIIRKLEVRPIAVRGFVWILLCPASFGEFNTTWRYGTAGSV